MKRVLIHTLIFSPDGVSTAYLYNDIAKRLQERGYNDIAKRLQERGYEVVVLTMDQGTLILRSDRIYQ